MTTPVRFASRELTNAAITLFDLLGTQGQWIVRDELTQLAWTLDAAQRNLLAHLIESIADAVQTGI